MTSRNKKTNHSSKHLNVRLLWGEIAAELHDEFMAGGLVISNADFVRVTDIGMAVTARHFGQTLVDDEEFPIDPKPKNLKQS